MGIEPTLRAWEAPVLPLNYTRISASIVGFFTGIANITASVPPYFVYDIVTTKENNTRQNQMLKQFRQRFIDHLWMNYCHHSMDCRLIATKLMEKGAAQIHLDHLAVIDLPSKHSGIPHMQRLMEEIGYTVRGRDYLPKKQNDFCWMAERNCLDQPAAAVLPQIVVADFRLEEMPAAVSTIIEKYANQTRGIAWDMLLPQLNAIELGNDEAMRVASKYLESYFMGRDWPLPTFEEFATVHAFNELLAWVLIFGRRPNHFTFSIHLLDMFPDLESFNLFIEKDLGLALNLDSGRIKGGDKVGIAQSATIERKEKIQLEGGEIELPTTFVEFVWRYPATNTMSTPAKWGEYFTGFIPQLADQIIQSLYVGEGTEVNA